MNWKKNSFIIITLCLLAVLIAYPMEMLAAARSSITLWLTQVFPSLFPFMAATGILMGLGAANTLGHAMQGIMKPLFGVNGICAFPFIMGLISGYPCGAKMTASLYLEGEISKSDAQKVLRFCNNPGPLFVIGATGTALLQSPAMGYFLMLCIFCSSLSTGLLFRFTGEKSTLKNFSSSTSLLKNNDTVGAVMAKAIADATETMLQIGGFIILFGAVIQALSVTGIFQILAQGLGSLLPFSKETTIALLSGILEMTNGVALLSLANDPNQIKLCAIAAVLAFGGLSILAQTLAILSPIPLSSADYIVSKGINSLFAAVYAYVLFPIFMGVQQKTAPVFHNITETASNNYSLLPLLFFCIVVLWALLYQKRRE